MTNGCYECFLNSNLRTENCNRCLLKIQKNMEMEIYYLKLDLDTARRQNRTLIEENTRWRRLNEELKESAKKRDGDYFNSQSDLKLVRLEQDKIKNLIEALQRIDYRIHESDLKTREENREENIALKEEIEKLKAKNNALQWRPIATAPRDKEILVAFKNGQIVITALCAPKIWNEKNMTHWLPISIFPPIPVSDANSSLDG